MCPLTWAGLDKEWNSPLQHPLGICEVQLPYIAMSFCNNIKVIDLDPITSCAHSSALVWEITSHVLVSVQ